MVGQKNPYPNKSWTSLMPYATTTLILLPQLSSQTNFNFLSEWIHSFPGYTPFLQPQISSGHCPLFYLFLIFTWVLFVASQITPCFLLTGSVEPGHQTTYLLEHFFGSYNALVVCEGPINHCDKWGTKLHVLYSIVFIAFCVGIPI